MLIFDFDGVLLDSLNDVVLTSYNALNDQTKLSLSELPRDFVLKVKINRFHCQASSDFLVLAEAVYNNQSIFADQENNQDASNQILSNEQFKRLISASKIPTSERRESFFLARKRLIETSLDSWLAIHDVFQPLWSFVNKADFRLVLLTNKNRAAVELTCKHFNLKIEQEDIYSGDNGVTKQENLEKIVKRFNLSSVTFIDDSLKNLKDLREYHSSLNPTYQFTPLLALWGYVGEKDVLEAAELNIDSVQMEQFIARRIARLPGLASKRALDKNI